VLDEAIFTAPAHPNWGGTAMIGADGRLLGIGSLQLERGDEEEGQFLNMVIPIDLLTPILDKLLTTGQSGKPVRPWLGIYSTEIEDRIVIVGLAARGPAARADLRAGDIIVGVDGEEVSDLATLYRRIWSLGDAGVEIPLTIYRDGDTFDVGVNSGERAKFLKAPKMH
jgi:S1-C subfamily serine protease